MEIWPPAEAFYIEAMLFSSTLVLQSGDAVADWIERYEIEYCADAHTHSYQNVLDSLQNLIVHAAALSKYFWPVRDKEDHRKRGLHLRKRFGVKDDSPLKSRELRNSIEHFDERLDEYIGDGIVGNVVPFYLGPTPLDSKVPLHVFRAYYLDSDIFQVLGERYEIRPIIEEVARLHQLLVSAANNGYRLPVI